MFTRWQLVLLGVVVFQGASLSASEKKSPRIPLSCSEEARKESSLNMAALKQSLELRKEGSSELRKKEKSNPVPLYYDTPCGGRVVSYEICLQRHISPMAPWVPDYFHNV